MKLATRILFALALVGLLFPVATPAADDFFDVLQYSVKPVTGTIKEIDASLYNGRVVGRFNDANDNNNLDAGEALTTPVVVYNRDGQVVLRSPGTVTNRETLTLWAEDNAYTIMEAVFGANVSQVAGESDDAVIGQSSFRNRVLKRAKAKKAARTLAAHQQVNDDVKGQIEYLMLDVNQDDGNAYGGVLGYSHMWEGGAEFGFFMPYRYTTLDDQADSNSHFLALDFFTKFPVWEDENSVMTLGFDVFGSAFMLNSDAIDAFGNFKYGGGAFFGMFHDFRVFTLSYGADYKVGKAWLDACDAADDNVWLEEALDYINDQDPVHTVSYGANFGVPVGQSLALNFEYVRTNFFSSDIPDDRDVQSTGAVSFSWFPSDTFELNLGVRQTFEMEEIDVLGVTFGTLFRF